jgi:hypothetical protein
MGVILSSFSHCLSRALYLDFAKVGACKRALSIYLNSISTSISTPANLDNYD